MASKGGALEQIREELRELPWQFESIDKLENCSGIERSVIGCVYMRGNVEVQSLVRWARKRGVKLFPYSRGMNWGFGSRSPFAENSLLVDLSKMNRVLEVNREFGYAVIEAGVSQAELYRALQEQAPEWYFDVTGSSADSSILGNALERGIAYNSQRVDRVSDFEVVAGTGEIFFTGCAQHGNNRMRNLYRYGLGPALDGLLFQSNFGIVTRATVQLTRRPPENAFVSVAIEKAEQVPAFIESLRALLRENVIQCIPHIFNRSRVIPVIEPLWREQMQRAGHEMSDENASQFFAKVFPGSWYAILGLGGSAAVIKTARRRLQAELPPGARVQVLTSSGENRLRRWLKWVPFFAAEKALFHATQPMRDMVRGVPTNQTLQSMAWAHNRRVAALSASELDALPVAFTYITPFAPLTESDARQLMKISSETCVKHGFDPALSLNIIDRKILEAVLSIHYSKASSQEVARARACVRDLQESFLRAGYFPYRLDHDSMGWYENLPHASRRILSDIKRLMDPDNVISPGRYLPRAAEAGEGPRPDSQLANFGSP